MLIKYLKLTLINTNKYFNYILSIIYQSNSTNKLVKKLCVICQAFIHDFIF